MVRRSALLLVVARAVWADPLILLQPAVGTPQGVTLTGRVLKHGPSGGHSTVGRNLRWLATSNWEGAALEVAFQGVTASGVAGHDGDFEVRLEPPAGKAFEPGLGVASAHVRGASASALVQVLPASAPFLLVSDFDDTLAVTNVVSTTGLLKASLGEDETTHPVVPGMSALYRCLRAGHPEPPGYVLVSGTPLQYLGRVEGFLKRHDFPPFAVALRDLGPGTLSNYKQPIIRRLLHEVPNAAVLVGDSGEHDPEVYRQMAAEFPERVKAIYIRNAGHAEDASRFEGMLLFTQPEEAARDAVKKGLASAACVAEAFPPVDAGGR